MDNEDAHIFGGMHAQVHDRVCICSKDRYRMIKSEDVPCGRESCPKCGRTLMRL